MLNPTFPILAQFHLCHTPTNATTLTFATMSLRSIIAMCTSLLAIMTLYTKGKSVGGTMQSVVHYLSFFYGFHKYCFGSILPLLSSCPKYNSKSRTIFSCSFKNSVYSFTFTLVVKNRMYPIFTTL